MTTPALKNRRITKTMIQNKTDAKLKIYFSDCVKVIRISDILTPASATERFKTLTPDLCYFGDTISQLVKAVQEGTTHSLAHVLPETELYRYGRIDGKCFAMCIPVSVVETMKKNRLIFFPGKHKKTVSNRTKLTDKVYS